MSDHKEDLSDEEVDYLEERIALLFHDKEDLEAHEMLMLAYMQGMTECYIHLARPDLADYEGADVLMKLAKRAATANVAAVDKRSGPDPRRN